MLPQDYPEIGDRPGPGETVELTYRFRTTVDGVVWDLEPAWPGPSDLVDGDVEEQGAGFMDLLAGERGTAGA